MWDLIVSVPGHCLSFYFVNRSDNTFQSKKISNDQELIQSDPTSSPQIQKGNN